MESRTTTSNLPIGACGYNYCCICSGNDLSAQLSVSFKLAMASSAMEGVLKKRNGRMQQWTSRYFVLEGTRISYKLKQDSPSLRGSFDLVCGCQVTPIVEEGLKKKLYTFWIVWPRDKNSKELEEAEDSGDEAEKDGVAAAEAINSGKPEPASKSKVVQSLQKQLDTQKRQRTLVEQQIDRHQAHDNSVQLGVKVAAVAVGGVVIGALTAGIGLIPYITVVGITAVASGSAVAYQWKRPADSRLLLACDSLADASEWKMAVERQIARLEDVQKPMLPASVDPEIIASLLNKHNSNRFGVWKRVAIYEGVRVLEHVYPCAGRDPLGRPLEEAGDKGGVPVFNSMYKSQGTFRCRKAHMSFPCSSINTFLTLMSTKLWPIQGSIQVISIETH